MAMAPITARVVDAFFAWGRRKAGTPFEMASTPVRAVDPDENACRITKRPTLTAVPSAMWLAGTTACGQLLTRHLDRPTTTMVRMKRMKPYVGMANSVPDSRTPRRLASVISRTKPIDIQTRYLSSEGAAETMAKTPATVETDTVST